MNRCSQIRHAAAILLLIATVNKGVHGWTAAARYKNLRRSNECQQSQPFAKHHFNGPRYSVSSSFSKHSNVNDSLQVFDHTFRPDVCEELHELALDHAERGGMDGSSIFYRDNSNPLTPLEAALDSVLREIGDENPIVEYWSRQEYLNLDAHADIDEEELEDDGVLRYPKWGHVLYLHIEDNTQAPTAVFPSKLGGWAPQASATDRLPLVFVPAVPGRVLRFPGSALHAVPKPATRWLLPRQDQQQLDCVEEREKRDDKDHDSIDNVEDDWDEDDDDWIERSVILFNTWSGEGPRGVARDTNAAGALPDGIALVESDSIDREQKQLDEWHEEYGMDMKDIWCSPRQEWTFVPLGGEQSQQKSFVESNDCLYVPLMGNQERRLHPRKFTHLNVASKELLESAALQPQQPTQVWLESYIE